MRTSNLANEKFKCVYKDLQKLAILTKSETSGKVLLTFAYASVGNNYLEEFVTTFTLAISVEVPAVVSIDSYTAFANTGNNIQTPINKVIFCASRDLSRFKKQKYWVVLNASLLPMLLTEAPILDCKMEAANLLKVFAKCIAVKGTEEEEDKSEEEEGCTILALIASLSRYKMSIRLNTTLPLTFQGVYSAK